MHIASLSHDDPDTITTAVWYAGGLASLNDQFPTLPNGTYKWVFDDGDELSTTNDVEVSDAPPGP
jgi:hypothetical protein